MEVRYRVPWTLGVSLPGAVLAAVSDYAIAAKESGLDDEDIAEDLEHQWPGQISGGWAVWVADGALWVGMRP